MQLLNRIGTYDKFISNEELSGSETLDDLVKYYDDVPKGYLEEIIVGYDNYNYRGYLRVTGRGNDLVLEARYERLLDDGYGAFSSTLLDKKDVTKFTLIESIEEFIFWFDIRASHNLNKTGIDRYVI